MATEAALSQSEREYAWLIGRDTGLSSLTIFSVLSVEHGKYAMATRGWFRFTVPHDPADLGRCLRLLDAVPEWRDRLGEVAAVYPEWAPLVRDWTEIERLYVEELPARTAPKCYAAMRVLIDEGRAQS